MFRYVKVQSTLYKVHLWIKGGSEVGFFLFSRLNTNNCHCCWITGFEHTLRLRKYHSHWLKCLHAFAQYSVSLWLKLEAQKLKWVLWHPRWRFGVGAARFLSASPVILSRLLNLPWCKFSYCNRWKYCYLFFLCSIHGWSACRTGMPVSKSSCFLHLSWPSSSSIRVPCLQVFMMSFHHWPCFTCRGQWPVRNSQFSQHPFLKLAPQ